LTFGWSGAETLDETGGACLVLPLPYIIAIIFKITVEIDKI
jgi:hypothetical protein